jgi:NAD(P)-dependent dehydrogenase (short-subunit alcohol dehydrogenase family)
MLRRRVLIVGAETEIGGAVAARLAHEGAVLALVAATPKSEAAFAVKRLARRLGAPIAQAIDATNEMAMRVMVRQVGKEMAGLDAVVSTSEQVRPALLARYGSRELARSGGGAVIAVAFGKDIEAPPGVAAVPSTGRSAEEVAAAVSDALAGHLNRK